MRPGGVDIRWLLRTWRAEVARLSQATVARRLGVSEAAVSMWENGRRRVDFAHLVALDGCVGAGGALVDMALALGTPRGLPAGDRWAHNPQGPSSPRWAWVRPQPGALRVDALLLWGAFAFDCSADCDDRGVIVTSPVSMPNPPAWVHLREPGWVDFGRGEVPMALGIPTFTALSAARLARGGHSPAGLVAPEVVERFTRDPAFARAVLRFFGTRPELVRDVFSVAEAPRSIVDLTAEPAEPAPRGGPPRAPRLRTLREARGLSRADAARLATELLPYDPISDDQVGVVERGGIPMPRHLLSRLDRVYRAGGRCGVERVEASGERSPFAFEFPRYWIGPVWFTVGSPADDARGHAVIQQGIASKRLYLRAGTTVTCRRPTEDAPPFVVSCPERWTVTGGMGMHLGARDVNWGWHNVDDSSTRGDAPVHEVLLGLFGRTRAEFDELLRAFSRPAGT
jgi:transcriptional regulator with XRE-family HTH domain